MAQNDPYNPDFVNLADAGTATFDGSASSTDAAIISEVAGDSDALIYIEESNDGGTNWTQITTLSDDAGNTTFTGAFHTQYNRIMVQVGERRLKIENNSGGSGNYSVSGDER